ncbi:MAG: hypothetical protein LBI18_02675 [Planctomycetaceae bacterium]|jgi:hypothetical protein|nr:hypothetical protein [Planctomycetaceae bacterium]
MNYKNWATFIATFTTILFVTLCLTGCGNNSNNESTADFQKRVWGDAGTNQSSGSSSSSGKQKTPDEKELNEIVKKQLWKDFVSDSPFEIVDVTANWVEKTAQSCSGDFSVNLRAKENLYAPISVKDGLEKLGIKNLYEGELKQAEEKTYKLPEPYKTNLRNDYPQEQLNRFQFVHIIRPKGSPDSAGGVVELSRYGDEWSASIRMKKAPSVERCLPESGLNNNVQKLDDPETKKAVETIIQKRKDYVDKVDAAIKSLNDKFQADLEKQKQNFFTFCKPNSKHEGSWKYSNTSGRVVVQFGDYESADKTIISGVYFSPQFPQFTRQFTVSVNTKEVVEFPVTGKLQKCNYHNHSDWPSYRTDSVRHDMLNTLLSNDRDKVRINFVGNKLVFQVWASGWGSIQFDF